MMTRFLGFIDSDNLIGEIKRLCDVDRVAEAIAKQQQPDAMFVLEHGCPACGQHDLHRRDCLFVQLWKLYGLHYDDYVVEKRGHSASKDNEDA